MLNTGRIFKIKVTQKAGKDIYLCIVQFKGRFWYPEMIFVKILRFWVTSTINMSKKLSFRWYHINMDHWLRIDENFRLKIIFLVKTCWICKLWTGFTQIVKMTKMQIQEKLDLSGFLSDRPVQYTKMTGNSNTAQ